jgi:quinol monooxygenase YgiN
MNMSHLKSAFLLTAVVAALTPLPSAATEPASQPVALAVTITVKQGQRDRFIHAMQAQVQASRSEPGVAEFNAFASQSDPLVFHTFERYRDKAAFEAHLAAPNMAKLLAVLKEVQAKELEATFLQLLP